MQFTVDTSRQKTMGSSSEVNSARSKVPVLEMRPAEADIPCITIEDSPPAGNEHCEPLDEDAIDPLAQEPYDVIENYAPEDTEIEDNVVET